MRQRSALPSGRRSLNGSPALECRSVGCNVRCLSLPALWSEVCCSGRWHARGSFPALLPDALILDAWLRADFAPFLNSLEFGVLACLIALPIAPVWLEWGPARFNAVLYAPLIVPVLPLAVGQYSALLHLDLRRNGCRPGLGPSPVGTALHGADAGRSVPRFRRPASLRRHARSATRASRFACSSNGRC